ncbi:response regulator [Microbacterium sp. YY-01]|uniref:response regulator n=1 Tax=Microbacterium sp. YY-01 TaxID=3421634 RepID=UPI003D186B1C
MTIRVMLVDDHAMLRAGFRAILETQPDIAVVGEAANGREAVALAATAQPDVITMDVQMPDMDGIEATRMLVANPAIQASIAIVTTFDSDDYLFAALDAGASGFLLKNAGPEQLISAVRLLADGSGMLAPEVTRRVLERFAQQPRAVASGTIPVSRAHQPVHKPAADSPTSVPLEPLTNRENDVLRLMAEAWTNAEIAAELFIGEATVKTHVSRILQKLGARDRMQAIVVAHRHGLPRTD